MLALKMKVEKKEIPEKLDSSLKNVEATLQYSRNLYPNLVYLAPPQLCGGAKSSSVMTDCRAQVTISSASEPLNPIPISTQGTPFSTPRHITSFWKEVELY